MATEIKLPRLGQGMESGTIVKWLKAEGDQVVKGEPLYELDTDKVTQEVEADASGVLLKIAVQGGEVEVGKTIAVIGEAGEHVEAPAEAKVDEDVQEEGSPGAAREQERERGREASTGDQVTELRRAISDGGRIKASPLARRIARERGIDLTNVAGTGPDGLVVPVIRSAERLSVGEIANARAELVERARAGKLQQGDLDGGTFTISNLGMFGIERFIAVLNPPQAAILAVGSVEDTVVAVDAEPAVRPRMEITLTCDHRAVDGATGAQFLTTVKQFLEEPGLAL